MRYLSVCSGIEAASVAWHRHGFTPVGFSEIDPFPCALLAHHYPNVPNWGDMTRFKEWPDATFDILVGGTPCQSFSVAGLRKGMADPRGNLALTYLAIADRYRPDWLVWENVPGVLSSAGGRDFGAFLGGLAELGYGWAYRVLDAQYFGLAQRRRRVFVVGSLRGWTAAAAVLFERESLRGHPAPGREAREGIAAPIAAGASTRGGYRNDADTADNLIAHALRADGFEDGTGRGTPLVPALAPTIVSNANRTGGDRPPGTDGDTVTSLIPVIMSSVQANAEIGVDISPTLHCLHDPPIAFNWQNGGGYGEAHDGLGISQDHTGPLSRSQVAAVAYGITDDETALEDCLPTMSIPSESGGGHPPAVAFIANESFASGDNDDVSPSLRVCGDVAIAFAQNQRDEVRQMDLAGALASEPGMKQQTYIAQTFESRFARNGRGAPSDIVPPLKAQSDQSGKGDAAPLMLAGMQVRRLTPRECERLQGFPDDYTLIPHRGKLAADGPRYKALGNSMAVPCMAWIGERIALVQGLIDEK